MVASLFFPSSSCGALTPVTASTSSNPYRNQGESSTRDLSNRSSQSHNAAIKLRTAPWMRPSLLLTPSEVSNPPKPRIKRRSNSSEDSLDKALTRRESGVRGKKVMKKIIRKVERLKEVRDSEEAKRENNLWEVEFSGGFDQILGGEDEVNDIGGKMPWESDEKINIFRRTKKVNAVTAAEMTLDKSMLGRLRREARKMRKWVKVKKAGVTQAVVDEIKSTWMNQELAMIKFDLPLCRNMDRAQEIIEMKTGGLVVHSKKNVLVVYRGYNYDLKSEDDAKASSFDGTGKDENHAQDYVNFFGDGIQAEPSVKGSLYEREADRLIDDLGPRYVDWWMRKPLPVDGDMLPEVVPGFSPPQRRCPPRTRSSLMDHELTYLRTLARSLPYHFVLGRNRGFQGLAAAILKLWERSLIAKIAVKWGALNTDSEEMANELKRLTGGVLILRNKFLIILFRGKDFLSPEIASTIVERERELEECQLHEEGERLKEIIVVEKVVEPLVTCGKTGTFSEFQELQSKFLDQEKIYRDFQVSMEAEKESLEKKLRKEEHKLSIMRSKIEKSATELEKLDSLWKPAKQDSDFEMLTIEERECFRKIGLKMSGSLVLGRRGIFDGVIEGLHQHWKHREVAKVITMQRQLSEVISTAKWLEAESRGVVVSVEKLKEGHAIIVYRGKNYQRPLKIVSQNLLSKRKALQRSLEMQRMGSLRFYANQKERETSDMKLRVKHLDQRIKTAEMTGEQKAES